MTIDRAIEILNPEHREHYDGMDEVNEACRMGMEALERMRWIEKFQKFLFTLSGNKTPDIWSSDYRLKTLAFRRLVTQEVGYICANGVSMDEKEKLGADFDIKLQAAAKLALSQGVSYGYWNLDHLEVFSFADTPGNPVLVPGNWPKNSFPGYALRAGRR